MTLIPLIAFSDEQLIHSLTVDNGQIIKFSEIKEATLTPALQKITTRTGDIYYSEEIENITLNISDKLLPLPASELLKEKVLVPQLRAVGGDGSGGG